MTTRDIVVAGALPRHQVKQWLNAHGVGFWYELDDPHRDTATFHITRATEAQWGQIQEWVKKVTG